MVEFPVDGERNAVSVGRGPRAVKVKLESRNYNLGDLLEQLGEAYKMAVAVPPQ
jgi:hypothetical protein